MRLPERAIRHPITTILVFATLAGLGLLSLTRIGLELFPHLVEMEYAKGVVPKLPPNADLKWKFSELTNTGASGDPTKGSKAKGEAMRRVLVNAVVEFITYLDSINWEYELK